MATLNNEVIINAPLNKIWDLLSNIEELEKYDPTVKKSKALSNQKNGIGAKRKVEMLDGKNWFEEECTIYSEGKELKYELYDCSFPIDSLKHSYSFEKTESKIKVKQVMVYKVKFGLIGNIIDMLFIRKQTSSGIIKFMLGLKKIAEST